MIQRPKLNTNFTMISNAIAQNTTLSDGALRLCVYLLSIPSEWDLTITALSENLKKSRTSITKYLKELQEAKILYLTKIKGEFQGFDFEFLQEKSFEDAQNYAVQNLNSYNINKINNNINKKYYLLRNSDQIRLFSLVWESLESAKPKQAKLELLDLKAFSKVEQSEVCAWLEHKALVVKNLKNSTKMRDIQKLERFKREGKDICKIIDYCISNGYRGLYEPPIPLNVSSRASKSHFASASASASDFAEMNSALSPAPRAHTTFATQTRPLQTTKKQPMPLHYEILDFLCSNHKEKLQKFYLAKRDCNVLQGILFEGKQIAYDKAQGGFYAL
ncbi:hypothetical protein CQA37_09650 [Helicobacter sp. MIT 99-10781]|uniref:hypothetical protein n=1 Tax=Helicobacter sp. MIT 99-10781 TaxID=1332285 RepID=UPI000E20C254|nr:hypothetical protein [Helicobacter sp. MIT 99-10781]RDU51527.1 hypothetical protein CQA37_09650 [Helicobacter sp. MIT 99-10781]